MDLKSRLVAALGVPLMTSDDAIVQKVIAMTGKAGTSRNAAMHATMNEGAALSRRASLHQAELAKDGIIISHAVAVRAVQDSSAS